MTTSTNGNKGFRFPILQGILPIDRSRLPLDIIAGISLAPIRPLLPSSPLDWWGWRKPGQMIG